MDPFLRVKPPGPKARAVINRDSKVVSQSMIRECQLVLHKAKGVNLWDVDGNRFLDFTSGVAVMSVGWNNPKVVAAIRNQLRNLTHGAFLDFYSDVPVKLAEELVRFLPRNLNKVYFSNSGAEAIEAAMKLARFHTKRKYFISFYGGFHGRTYGALSLTSARVVQRNQFGPFLPVIHVPYPNPYRCPLSVNANSCDLEVVSYIEDEIFKREVSPEEVAAIFVEPIQGEGGYIVPHKGFLKRIRKLCDDHGILLVDDEIQAGCYRTGKFLAIENFGVEPDIVCLSKALGGGLPLGVTVSSSEIMSWPPGSHASTFGGNTLACAAALAVLDVMGEKGFGEKVTEKGNYIRKYLGSLQEKVQMIGDVRGIGLMIGIELVKDRRTKEPATHARDKIVLKAFESGLVVLPAGESTIRLSPPLIIAREDIDTGLRILGKTLEGV
ncbi:MAG TPA: acetyl ornithine aminotransferase family protein [Candidatus Bathyarchaeia archaeon]|nr:acetyl ornithine aminotransferase family protein [Candidatus Bathyarchaeia archaeon]